MDFSAFASFPGMLDMMLSKIQMCFIYDLHTMLTTNFLYFSRFSIAFLNFLGHYLFFYLKSNEKKYNI